MERINKKMEKVKDNNWNKGRKRTKKEQIILEKKGKENKQKKGKERKYQGIREHEKKNN